MSQTHVDGVSQQELLCFKEEFGPTAFVCDRRGCDRATHGFSSRNELIDHQTRHNGGFKCSVHGCAYNDVGFKTTRDLQAHRRKRHRVGEIKRVPKRFRQTNINNESHTDHPTTQSVTLDMGFGTWDPFQNLD